jgi:threonylcarbamoyladenosine tRNA methylthiotransferase MtaB
VAPFLHICLQSGSDSVLRRMGRAYDTEKFAKVCAEARDKVPGIALGTDLICAFPGETDEEFDGSLAFCERMHFAKMHVFRYSKRPGTPAAARTDQVPAQVAADRARRVRDLANKMRLEEMRSHAGEEALVLVQEPGKTTDGHLFDVEVDENLAPDTLVRVRLVMDGDRLIGVEP